MPNNQPGQWPDLTGRITPGILASSAAWPRLGQAHDQLWRRYIPPLGAAVAPVTATTTLQTLGRVWLRSPDTPIDVEILCRVLRLTGTGSVRIYLDGNVVATVTQSTAVWAQGNRAVTSPGEVLIQADTTADTWRVGGWSLRYRQTLDPDGSPGDYVTSDATHAQAGVPVTSERTSRLIRGPSDIARLRPATIWSGHGGGFGPRPQPVITASQRLRRYYVDGYTSGAGSAIVTISGQMLEMDGDGAWTHHEIQLGPGRHQLVVTGDDILQDLQIVRAP